MKNTLGLGLAALVLASGLSGCAMFNRGMMNYTRTTTMGKELIDLKDAKDKGAITDEEYAKAKKEMLESTPIKVEAGCKK